MKLLITPKPEKDEGFISYLLRLTEANGYETPSWILSLSGIDYMELQWKFTFVFSCSEGFKRLAKLTGNALSDLIGLLYLPSPSAKNTTCDTDYNFYGAFLNRSIIRPHCPKVCVKCLNESGYCRQIWECSLVSVCPIHECLLLDTCPKCKRRLKAIRNRLSICVCGCDWRELQPDVKREHEIAVSRRIYQLCGLLPLDHHSKERLNPLQNLALQDFVTVLTFIAGLECEMSWATGRPSKSIKLRNEDLHGYFTKAYQLFEPWPHNFHQFLDKRSKGNVRLNPRDGKLDTALKEEFGALFKRLYCDLRAPQFDFLRDAFAKYLNNRLKAQYEDGDRVSSLPASDDAEYISVTEARRLLKLSHDSILDLVKTGEIAFVIRNQDKTICYLLRLTDVATVKIQYEQALGSRELAKELGIDQTTINRLVQEGRLRRKSRRTIDGYNSPKFEADAARRLLHEYNMTNMLDV
ncbi:MAG TPA: TniQ family protein [Anaerolineales bacterium]|nr:TniQ family protein [Anaerolineales bacterium]